jgi:hypothetical protein
VKDRCNSVFKCSSLTARRAGRARSLARGFSMRTSPIGVAVRLVAIANTNVEFATQGRLHTLNDVLIKVGFGGVPDLA